MRTFFPGSVLGSYLFLIISLTALMAEDWPRWRGPQGNGIAPEKNLRENWYDQLPPEVWRVPLGQGYSGITVSNNRVFTAMGDNHYEYCIALEESTGKEIWRRRIDYLFQHGVGNGPRVTPTVDGERVYAISGRGNLWCFRVSDGHELWHMQIFDQFQARNLGWGVASCPFIYKEKLFFNTGAGKGQSLVALDKLTGEVIWTSGDDSASYSTPTAAKIHDVWQIIFFSGEGLVGVVPEDGTILWRFKWKTSSNVNATVPIIKGNKIFISSEYGKGAALVAIEKDGENWQANQVWKNRKMQNHFATSIYWQGYVYGFHRNIFSCLEFTTGKIKWRSRAFHKGTLIGADNGYLFVLGEKGKLGLIQMSPRKCLEKGAIYPFCQSKCLTVPSLANGKLFVRDQKEMVCFDIRATTSK